MAKGKSRVKRWNEAAQKADAARDRVLEAAQELADALAELAEIQSEYQEWRDGLPENLDSSPAAEKLDAVIELELDGASDGDAVLETWGDITGTIDSALDMELPQGFGRD